MVTSKLIEESKWPYWYLVCGLTVAQSVFSLLKELDISILKCFIYHNDNNDTLWPFAQKPFSKLITTKGHCKYHSICFLHNHNNNNNNETSSFNKLFRWNQSNVVPGSACMVASVFNALAVYCFKMELPSRADLKWVIARSLLEDLHWYHGFLKWRKVQVETVLVNVFWAQCFECLCKINLKKQVLIFGISVAPRLNEPRLLQSVIF